MAQIRADLGDEHKRWPLRCVQDCLRVARLNSGHSTGSLSLQLSEAIPLRPATSTASQKSMYMGRRALNDPPVHCQPALPCPVPHKLRSHTPGRPIKAVHASASPPFARSSSSADSGDDMWSSPAAFSVERALQQLSALHYLFANLEDDWLDEHDINSFISLVLHVQIPLQEFQEQPLPRNVDPRTTHNTVLMYLEKSVTASSGKRGERSEFWHTSSAIGPESSRSATFKMPSTLPHLTWLEQLAVRWSQPVVDVLE
ncbi:hypothetical protein B0H11DRAFT_2332808 [Mycena galericulata]|nr:hypothetical protein B0H11DRAFT_2332808 [Mycena galericulata]